MLVPSVNTLDTEFGIEISLAMQPLRTENVNLRRYHANYMQLNGSFFCVVVCLHVTFLTPIRYYRPQTKFAKVMFSEVSVYPWGGMRGKGHAWWGRGHAWQWGCVHGGEVCAMHAPPRHVVNVWVVHILLECILVTTVKVCLHIAFFACVCYYHHKSLSLC